MLAAKCCTVSFNHLIFNYLDNLSSHSQNLNVRNSPMRAKCCAQKVSLKKELSMANQVGQNHANELSANRTSSKQKHNSQLSATLNHRLAAYGAAAVAMGVGIPAAAQVPVGHIVYTPADIPILAPGGSTISLDLNHDGVADFTITTSGYSSSRNGNFYKHEAVYETPATGNSAIGKRALAKGQIIDMGGQFRASEVALADVNFFAASGHFGTSSKGAFKRVVDKYLGVKFSIGGQMHEGWVRISMKSSFGDITGTITGYAYDTVPNETGLAAGQIRGGTAGTTTPEDSTAKPATLGMLGLGSAGLEMWRQ